MKYLKTYEAKTAESIDSIKHSIEDFLIKFEKHMEGYSNLHLNHFNFYKFPSELEYEFSILYYMYRNVDWKKGYSKIDKYIKQQVKKYVKKLIIKKFEENPDIYFKLKSTFDGHQKWGTRGTFQYINSAAIRYIFFAFSDALKNAPEYLSQSNKYNL